MGEQTENRENANEGVSDEDLFGLADDLFEATLGSSPFLKHKYGNEHTQHLDSKVSTIRVNAFDLSTPEDRTKYQIDITRNPENKSYRVVVGYHDRDVDDTASLAVFKRRLGPESYGSTKPLLRGAFASLVFTKEKIAGILAGAQMEVDIKTTDQELVITSQLPSGFEMVKRPETKNTAEDIETEVRQTIFKSAFENAEALFEGIINSRRVQKANPEVSKIDSEGSTELWDLSENKTITLRLTVATSKLGPGDNEFDMEITRKNYQSIERVIYQFSLERQGSEGDEDTDNFIVERWVSRQNSESPRYDVDEDVVKSDTHENTMKTTGFMDLLSKIANNLGTITKEGPVRITVRPEIE